MQKKQLILAIILVLLNLEIVRFFELKLKSVDILIIHAALFLLFFITRLIQQRLLQYKKQPHLILSVNFFRIIFCSVFLFFNVIVEREYEKSYIYNFLLVYFLFLFIENFLKWKTTRK